MIVPEANQGKPVRTDSHFLSTTLSQCTFLVIEDLCRVISSVSWAPFQYVPVVWQMSHPRATANFQFFTIRSNKDQWHFPATTIENVTMQNLILL